MQAVLWYNNNMDNSNELIKKRFIELSKRAGERGCLLYTGFLSLNEQALLCSLARFLYSEYALYGGADGCERRMARFGHSGEEGFSDFPIECVEIAAKSEKFSAPLTHRDCLGALMSMGVEREKIGDIVVRGKKAYVFTDRQLAHFFAGGLDSVGRTSVACSVGAHLPEGELYKTEEVAIRVASLRSDSIIAQLFRLSRGDAAALFAKELVFINGGMAKSASSAPKEGDIVSVRGYGRFIFEGVSGESKKGKLIVKLKRFV